MRPRYLSPPVGWRSYCLICDDVVWRWHRHTGTEVEAWSETRPLSAGERFVAEMVYGTGVKVIGGSMDLVDEKTSQPVSASEVWQRAREELGQIAESLGYSRERVDRDLAAESERFAARKQDS